MWILLGVQAGLLVLLWLGQLIQGARLRRIERQLVTGQAQAGPELQRIKDGNRESKRLFESWLDEEPARRSLPKKEQFAGFRKWRSEQGLNWNPDHGRG